MLALNKVDLLRREVLLEISKRFNEAYEFSDTFMISALKGSGVDDLRKNDREPDAGGAVALSGGPGGGCAVAVPGFGSDAGKNLSAAA